MSGVTLLLINILEIDQKSKNLIGCPFLLLCQIPEDEYEDIYIHIWFISNRRTISGRFVSGSYHLSNVLCVFLNYKKKYY